MIRLLCNKKSIYNESAVIKWYFITALFPIFSQA